MNSSDVKLEKFYKAHVAFVLADEGSPEEHKALQERNFILASLTENERSFGIAVALGIKNVLARLHNGQEHQQASEAA